jgi:hypothetical protein
VFWEQIRGWKSDDRVWRCTEVKSSDQANVGPIGISDELDSYVFRKRLRIVKRQLNLYLAPKIARNS